MIQSLFQYLVFSNLWVSLSAAFMSLGMATFLGSEMAPQFAGFAFGATLAVYNLHRLFRLEDQKNQLSLRIYWLKKNTYFTYALLFIGLTLAAYLYFSFLFTWTTFWMLSLSTLISLFYALRIKSYSKPLREIPYVKVHLIAAIWTIVLLIWPIIHENLAFKNYLPLTAGLYLFLVATTIPFDIRDLPFDAPKQKTIPQVIGVKNAKLLALLLLVTSGVLFYFQVQEITNEWLFYFLFAGSFMQIIFTSEKRSEWFFSGLIDGWFILLGCMMYLL